MAISDYLSKMLARLGQSSDDSGTDQSPEEQYYNSMSPVDALKFRTELQNKKQYSPEEASANLRQTGLDVAYATPVVGNILSAIDAPSYYSGAYHAAQSGDDQEARKNMLLGHLSTLGAVTGLPFGSMAERAASSGADRLNAILAYHGSPHDFDRFDMSKIGTGEGAQAYGHGLYFAENPETAKYYHSVLADVKSRDRVPTVEYSEDQLRQMAAIEADKIKAENLLHYADQMKGGASFSDIVRESPEPPLTYTFGDNIFKRPGAIYNVSLDVEPHQLLDWDKPLSEQSEQVKAALAKIPHQPTSLYSSGGHGNIPFGQEIPVMDRLGEGYVRGLAERLGRPYDPANPYLNEYSDYEAASRVLREAGIPGIRYLDQGSRGASGDPTHNIVMFDDSLIKMLGKE